MIMFHSVINSSGLTLTSISLCVLSAVILGIMIAFVHMKTSKYTKNYVVTLAVLPLLVSIVMIMVNGNLGTGVAIAGAFSLIRFRSIPGTSKEIVSVFWAMAIGIAVGMGQIVFAGIVTVVVALLLLLFYYTKFGENQYEYKVLDITVPEDLDYDKIFDEVLDKYLTRYELTSIKTTNLGSLYELKYDILLKKSIREQDFVNELRVKNGNLKICIHKARTEELL